MDSCHGLVSQMSSWAPGVNKVAKATPQQLGACGIWGTSEDPGQCSLPTQPASHCCAPGSTGAAVFSGALIYAIHAEEILAKHPSGGSFGYCFALAWVAFPLALVSGIVYIHLRKRE